jgi:hypothetical protein
MGVDAQSRTTWAIHTKGHPQIPSMHPHLWAPVRIFEHGSYSDVVYLNRHDNCVDLIPKADTKGLEVLSVTSFRPTHEIFYLSQVSSHLKPGGM